MGSPGLIVLYTVTSTRETENAIAVIFVRLRMKTVKSFIGRADENFILKSRRTNASCVRSIVQSSSELDSNSDPTMIQVSIHSKVVPSWWIIQ